MALDTFANLKQSIQRLAHRNDTAFVIDDFVALAENKIDNRLRLQTNELRATASLTTRFIEFPTRFLQMRRLSLISGSTTYELKYKTPEAMTIKSAAGMPQEFTMTSQIEFDRVPSGTYTLEMSYYARLNPLSTSNTTNDVLTNYPNLYLYGALAELHRWARDESLADYYDGLFDKYVAESNKQEDRGRFGVVPRMASQGATP